ncbi:MAG: carboxypeptidase-like regulatory domain-containing protein, partial [Bacteroidia bacterium]|nr:carboxypeptidase-like regulatory domain-containing protein [Bacteroidia bacterium]
MKKIILLLTGFLLVCSGIAQTFQVSGKIVDQVSKQPLTGASVFCQNTTLGTVTNASGEFTMW